MRRVLIVVGVLGSGTALSFLAAAAILLAAPDARLVPNSGTPGSGVNRGFAEPVKGFAIPLPIGQNSAEGVVVDDTFVDLPLEMDVDPMTQVDGVNVEPGVDEPPQSGTAP